MRFLIKPRLPHDFDVDEYLVINEDVKIAGLDAKKHYVKHGIREGRKYKLHQLVPVDFVAAEYKLINQDISYSTIPAEVHYYYHGKAEGRRYKLIHSTSKSLAGEFDIEWYVAEYPEIVRYADDPFEHYLKYGRYEGRHARFNEVWYREEYAQYLNGWDQVLIEHYRQIGKAACFHADFDPVWYITHNSDVSASEIDPLTHYQQLGRKEGRDPAFSRTWYEHEYRDFLIDGVDAFNHYMTIGKSKGLAPAINHFWYIAEYPDILATDLLPYAHYLKYGKDANYKHSAECSGRVFHARLSNFPDAYDSRYEPKASYAQQNLDVKAIAFYLPQFHRVSENDRWWGLGFTEWTNTRAAQPLFVDHYQPRTPHDDIGYYDLSDAETLRRQCEMAKEFGIHAFCFYHYWFSGKRLLETPLDNLLNNKDIDQKFMICWANESWTRTWDGSENNVLVAQEYREEDPLAFIKDAEKYLIDDRYVRVGSNPILLVYKPHVIPYVGNVFAEWRRYWESKYPSKLEIWCVRTDPTDMNYERLNARFDAIVEFPPHIVPHTRHLPSYTMQQGLAGIQVPGNFYDYDKLVQDITSFNDYHTMPKKPFHRSVMLGWDNTARRKQGQSIWYGFSIDAYERWLGHVVTYTRSTFPEERRFCFINAWNEWAEGTYLEPDKKTGYTALNATARALFGATERTLPVAMTTRHATYESTHKKALVHIHAFYPQDIELLLKSVKPLIDHIDVVITTPSLEKKSQIDDLLTLYSLKKDIIIRVVPNFGRDVGPMLIGIADLINKYEIFGHFHTKRSPTVEWGALWGKYLWENLIGSGAVISNILEIFNSRSDVGFIKAPVYPLIEPHVSWGDVKTRCESILNELGVEVRLPSVPSFPVGNMFWCKVDAVAPILGKPWSEQDFEIEDDQISGTVAHCIERIWEYVATYRSYKVLEVLNIGSDIAPHNRNPSYRRLCIYVHYSAQNSVSDADLEYLRQSAPYFSEIVVVSNSAISDRCMRNLRLYATNVLQRQNSGLDFAAWRDAIRSIGWERLISFDEVVLANNSCYGPLRPLGPMFEAMNRSDIDFWGITAFPLVEVSNRPEAVFLPNRTIQQHLQSYWLAFKKPVVASIEFYRFFEEIEDKADFMDVVASYETRLTKLLSDAGYTWAAYVPDAEHLQVSKLDDPRYNAPYNNPYEHVILGSPFVKKRAKDYNASNTERVKDLCHEIGHFPAHLIE